MAVPTGANTGNVVVTVSGVPSNGMSFTVIPAPTITGLSPTSGAVGTTVTISGTNFGTSQGTGHLWRHAGNDIFGLECDQHRGGGADRRQHGEGNVVVAYREMA